MSEVIIASTIEARKEWSIGLNPEKEKKDGKTVFGKRKSMTFDYGRTRITEEEFKALKDQQKGFVKLLKNGKFSEPETHQVKHDDETEKAGKKHSDEIERLKEAHVKDKEKAVTGIKSEINKQKLEFEKKLEKSNTALIDSEAVVKKLNEQIAALKKGK